MCKKHNAPKTNCIGVNQALLFIRGAFTWSPLPFSCNAVYLQSWLLFVRLLLRPAILVHFAGILMCFQKSAPKPRDITEVYDDVQPTCTKTAGTVRCSQNIADQCKAALTPHAGQETCCPRWAPYTQVGSLPAQWGICSPIRAEQADCWLLSAHAGQRQPTLLSGRFNVNRPSVHLHRLPSDPIEEWQMDPTISLFLAHRNRLDVGGCQRTHLLMPALKGRLEGLSA